MARVQVETKHDFAYRKQMNIQQLNVGLLSKNIDLIRQFERSLDDRQNGRIYDQEKGLEYLRTKCFSDE